MYKTLYYRYTAKKRYKLLESLLLKGATLMLQHQQGNAGTELALLLLEHYKTISALVKEETIGPLLEIFSHYTSTFSTQQRVFIKNAINWSSNKENNDQGAPALHDAFATFYDSDSQYGLAQAHFLRGNLPLPYAKMLVRWSVLGYDDERDLFIARAVLQYLCLSKLGYAKIIFIEFQKEIKLDTPLSHFLEYLLEVVEQKSVNGFKQLRENYLVSINRDDTFQQYLEMIGTTYFGIAPPQSSGGGFMNIMQAFMRGGQ